MQHCTLSDLSFFNSGKTFVIETNQNTVSPEIMMILPISRTRSQVQIDKKNFYERYKILTGSKFGSVIKFTQRVQALGTYIFGIG